MRFPDNGLGANVLYAPGNAGEPEALGPYYVTAGLGSSAADSRQTTLNDLDRDDVFHAAEFGLTPTFNTGDGPMTGAYRVLMWNSQLQDDGDAVCLALSLDQELVPGVVQITRYGNSRPDVGGDQHFVSAGVGFENPFGRASDLLAVGGAYYDTGDSGEESVVEAFYRLQLTCTLALTPDLQVDFNPFDSDEDTVIVGGMRL